MPPDRHHDRFGHAGFFLDPGELAAIGEIGGAAAADSRGIDVLRLIGREHRDRRIGIAAGLRAIELDHPIAHRQRGEHAVDRALRYAGRLRLGAQGLQIALKAVLGLRDRRAAYQGAGNRRSAQPEPSLRFRRYAPHIGNDATARAGHEPLVAAKNAQNGLGFSSQGRRGIDVKRRPRSIEGTIFIRSALHGQNDQGRQL